MYIILHKIVNNKDANVKYVYKSEFMTDNQDNKYIDMDNFNPDNHMKTESPLIYHVYNNKKIKSFQNYLPFFYKIYNVSAMKMHKMATKIGGIVRGVFTDTIIKFLKVKSTNLNVIKILLVVLEKQLLKILLNASIQNQEHLIILKSARNQLNLHKLKNLN